jgi:hypothetical protein
LLVGAAEYGDGFAPLPAVRNDIRSLADALAQAGYEVEICSDEVAASAQDLEDRLTEFCASGGAEDVRLLYFSGHGLRVDNTDCIVPARTHRQDALDKPTRRVSTDLSALVARGKVGLVVFVLDACRNADDAPITKGALGAASDLRRPAEWRFVRFFGCASGQVCQTFSSDNATPLGSVFTDALVKALRDVDCVNLDTLKSAVERHCKAAIDADPALHTQTPMLSHGEPSAETRAALQLAIFERAGPSRMGSVWPAFQPDKLHCLTVLSEDQVRHEEENGPSWGLTQLVNGALVGKKGNRIWDAFRTAFDGQALTGGKIRRLGENLTPGSLAKAAFSVLDAFADGAALEQAVRAVVEADIVVFDVTHFEPAVMLLLGVRSACRRALTICSHGAGWREGMPLSLPFNLQDLNVNSHTAAGRMVGKDDVIDRFVKRVETGLQQLAKHPAYQDLPGFEELRQLGSDSNALDTIPVQERVVVLCSYSKHFFENWRYLREKLEQQLSEHKQYSPEIERVIDYGTSQLVRQGLYEQIRRVAACVVDWSELRASVFVELGARLAISPYGAVQLIEESWLLRNRDKMVPKDGGAPPPPRRQEELLQRLFAPGVYQVHGDRLKPFEEAARELFERNPNRDGEAAYNRIYRVAWRHIGGVQRAQPSVASALKRQADALYQTIWETDAKSPGLFTDNQYVKQDNLRAAVELRLAAWLYLEHGVKAERRRADPALTDLYQKLGDELRKTLADMDAEFRAMGRMIGKRLATKD